MRQLSLTVQQTCSFLLGIAALFALTTVMEPAALMDGDPTAGWFNMINLHHNALIPWRFGHVTQALAQISPLSLIAERPLVPLTILLIGSTLVVRDTRLVSSIGARFGSVYAVLPCALLLIAGGIDPLVIGSACWIPLIAFVGSSLLRHPNSTLRWLLLAIMSVENSFNANQVSPLSGVLALGLIKLLQRTTSKEQDQPCGIWLWLAIIILAPTVLTLVITPMPFLPKYPRSAHVVPFSNVEGYVRPLLGGAYPFDTIDRGAAKHTYQFGAAILSALAAALYLLAQIRLHPLARSITVAGLVLAICAYLDTQLPEDWAMIAPIASISRLLPWGSTYSMTSIALGLSAWCLGYVVAVTSSRRSLALTVIAATLLIAHGSRDLYHPYLRSSGLLKEEKIAAIARTPSASIIRMIGPHTSHIEQWLAQLETSNRLPAKDVKSFGASVTIWPEPRGQTLPNLTQGEPPFRWSTRTGQQHGNETLSIRFSSPTRIRGIELDPGAFSTDYPRGLTVRGGNCSSPESAPVLFEAPLWQGALRLTPKGLPYFAPRNDVRIIFPNEVVVECVFAQQTARAPFDWSVSRIGIVAE